MRLATLDLPDRRHTPVEISDDGTRYRVLHEAESLAAWLDSPLPAVAPSGPVGALGAGVRFAPTIPRPGALWCVGLNYEDHRLETGRARAPHPTLFMRFPASLVGHEAALVRPRVSQQLDFEGELAVVIGRPGHHIDASEALDHVAGYACFNDASVRDWQAHSSQFGPGKNFWRTGALGPWLSSADEVGDPQSLRIETRLNGETVQQSHTSRMTWSVRALIAYISTFTPLDRGDVIATGTPSGVGVARRPPLWMRPGDIVEVEIERVGLLRNRVVDEDDDDAPEPAR